MLPCSPYRDPGAAALRLGWSSCFLIFLKKTLLSSSSTLLLSFTVNHLERETSIHHSPFSGQTSDTLLYPTSSSEQKLYAQSLQIA